MVPCSLLVLVLWCGARVVFQSTRSWKIIGTS